MKILFTTATYWPCKDGIQAVTQYQAEGLQGLGHEVTVVTNVHKDMPRQERHNGVSIIRYPIQNKHSLYFGNKKEYRRLVLSVYDSCDCMINVATEQPFTDWLIPLIGKIKGKKILVEHGISNWKLQKKDFESTKRLAHGIYRCLRFGIFYKVAKKYLKKYDYVTNLHEFSHGNEYFKKYCGIDCKVLYNAVESAFFYDKLPFPESFPANYFVCIANYCTGKNQVDTLEAFYKVGIKNVTMIFVGSSVNDYYNTLMNRNEKLRVLYNRSLDVRFLHDIPRESIPSIVRYAELAVMNSLSEHFPITICEAMASGVPFVSSKAGIASYLPGVIIAESVTATAYWMRMLHENKEIARKIGDCGKNFAFTNLRIEDKVRQLNELIES